MDMVDEDRQDAGAKSDTIKQIHIQPCLVATGKPKHITSLLCLDDREFLVRLCLIGLQDPIPLAI